MKIILNLALITIFFIQTSNGQIINYDQIALIVVGDDYVEEDIQIIKENIKINKDEKLASRLLMLDNMLYKKFVAQKARNIPCEEIEDNVNKDKLILDNSIKEIETLKKEYENNNNEEKLASLNKKIADYNALTEKRNSAIKNYKVCLKQQRVNKDEYNEISDVFYKAYYAKKNAVTVTNND